MITIIKEFENFAMSIKDYMDKSHYKTKYFIEKLGLSEPTFYRKLKNKTFSISEIVTLSELLFPNEFYEYKLQESIRKGREDYENNRVEDAKKLISDLKKRYL